jgi:hypothetical protein
MSSPFGGTEGRVLSEDPLLKLPQLTPGLDPELADK